MNVDWSLTDQEIVKTIKQSANLDQCVLCGKCAAVCPSHRNLNQELFSPRGRVNLINALIEGSITPGKKFFLSLLSCLGCGACEKACPTNVRSRWAGVLARNLSHFRHLYGEIRECLRDSVDQPFPTSVLEHLNISVEKNEKPFHLRFPDMSKEQKDMEYKVIYFPDWVRNYLLPESACFTFKLLNKMGFEVKVPQDLTYSGALFIFTGELGIARALASKNLKILGQEKDTIIICDCASCMGALISYLDWFPEDSDQRNEAIEMAERVRILSEFIDEISHPSDLFGSYEGIRVAYLDSCAMRYGLEFDTPPRRLLDSLKGVERIEFPVEDCCPGWPLWLMKEESELTDLIFQHMIDFLMQQRVEILIVEDAPSQLALIKEFKNTNLSIQIMALSEFLFSRKDISEK
jgi:glycolate oxidase iron-sulfur subunit